MFVLLTNSTREPFQRFELQGAFFIFSLYFSCVYSMKIRLPTDTSLEDGKYCYTIKIPSEGYIAAFGEAVYPQEPLTAQFCTNVKIFKGE